MAEYCVATISDLMPHRRLRPPAADPPCPWNTTPPSPTSATHIGKRLAGKLHEPFERAGGNQLVRLSFARAKKLARAAECLVYSLTPRGVLAENHPKNRGFVGILRGQKCLKRRFHGDLPLESGLAARARCLGFSAGVAAVSRPRSSRVGEFVAPGDPAANLRQR